MTVNIVLTGAENVDDGVVVDVDAVSGISGVVWRGSSVL